MIEINPNKQVLETANSFVKICDIAYDRYGDYSEFLHAYITNAAFAIELFLKSLCSTPYEKELFSVGDVKIVKEFATANVHGHELDEIFISLPNNIKNQLELKYSDSLYNIKLCTLEDQLQEVRRCFVKARYGFEGKLVYGEEAEELMYLVKFFSHELN